MPTYHLLIRIHGLSKHTFSAPDRTHAGIEAERILREYGLLPKSRDISAILIEESWGRVLIGMAEQLGMPGSWCPSPEEK